MAVTVAASKMGLARLAWAFGVACAAFGALGLGCTTYVDRAHYAYRDGRYLEVAEDLSSREHMVAALEPPSQAKYGLYLGLSLLQLNDLSGARQWLGFSSDIERRVPGSLDQGERVALDKGLSQLGAHVGSQQGQALAPVH
ncbi:MAG: hypothetical protein HY908_02490 [Myxococcales bacterium]|nr:hypothetical protein [Myxococcales bacterium]